jgi:hypothetical protein
LNNQPDALIIKIYSDIKLDRFRASSLPTLVMGKEVARNIKMGFTNIRWEGADEPSGSGRASVAVCCECGNELPGSSL